MPIIAKHRTSAFSGSAFEMVLRSKNIETLILMGHATSGVILSTVRFAGDLDYNLVVVEDGCADRDPEVQRYDGGTGCGVGILQSVQTQPLPL